MPKVNIKGLVLGFAAFAMMISGVAATAQPAAAAGPCESDYVLKGSHPMWAADGTRGGTLQIYWSNAAKKNCAVAMCYQNTCGAGTYREVKIKRTGDPTWNATDSGRNYDTYAGPVISKYSAGHCINVYARFVQGLNINAGAANITGKYCG